MPRAARPRINASPPVSDEGRKTTCYMCACRCAITSRLLESAHTARNYIVDEMVHIVGRRHAHKLRACAGLFLGVIAVVPLLVTLAGPGVIFLALGSHAIGVLAARWLFFAEAEHVVGLNCMRG